MMSSPDRSWRSVLKEALPFETRQATPKHTRRPPLIVLIQIKHRVPPGLLAQLAPARSSPACGYSTPMPEAVNYTAHELLNDGSQIEIRSLRPEDEADMLAAVGRTSAQSLQRRFFVVKHGFSEKERAFFMNIDFKNHVALVALARENDRLAIVAGGRYIVFEPERAELAFVVVDAWQGRGIGSTL